jgi:hypothetical protein
MTRESRAFNKEASLELSLAATKSLISNYAMRARHAEETASRLMSERLSTDQVQQLGSVIAAQMEQRANERAVQQQALLQSTLIVLNSALQGDEESLRTLVNTTVQQLTMALSHMNGGQAGKRNQG